MACYEHPFVETPNVDRLVNNGVLFDWTLDNGSKSCEQVIVNLHGGLNTIQDCSHMCIKRDIGLSVQGAAWLDFRLF